MCVVWAREAELLQGTTAQELGEVALRPQLYSTTCKLSRRPPVSS